MAKIKWVFVTSLIILLVALPLFAACPAPEAGPKTLYIGGPFALTGPFADDSAAVLAGFEDYVKYVNDNHILAPWYPDKKFPADITLEMMWRDDAFNPDKALSIYEELKAKGMVVYRNSGTAPDAIAPKLMEDHLGATTMSCEDFLLQPPKTVFVHFPIFTDCMAADADWFMEQWQETRKPRVAIFTADAPFGMSIVTPALISYLEGAGYEFVDTMYVPMVVTSAPTTQLMWLKENEVDLAIGNMIRAGSEPTIKEAVRLDMGYDLGYKICFGFAYPTSISPFLKNMGELGNGVISSGGMPGWDDPCQGIQFCLEMQDTYRGGFQGYTIGYPHGVVEGMIQVEALRLTLQEVPFEQLTPEKVLENGFYKVTNLDTAGIAATSLTFGPGDVQGLDGAVVAQVQNAKQVTVGIYPLRNLLPEGE